MFLFMKILSNFFYNIYKSNYDESIFYFIKYLFFKYCLSLLFFKNKIKYKMEIYL